MSHHYDPRKDTAALCNSDISYNNHQIQKGNKEHKNLSHALAHLVHHFILAEVNQLPKEAHQPLSRWP